MISRQNLILIMMAVLAGAPLGASASSTLNCANPGANLARNVQELARLTSNSRYSSRTPANNDDDDDDSGSGASSGGTQKGLGAIFNWFDNNVGRSRGLCTIGVRGALQAGGWWPCNVGMGLSPSRDIGRNLLSHGFKKISLKDPKKAKPGTILIYKSICSSRVDKNAAYGHIEMRTNKGYASDFFKTVPISSYNRCRQFQAAYVKVGPVTRSCNQSLSSMIKRRHR